LTTAIPDQSGRRDARATFFVSPRLCFEKSARTFPDLPAGFAAEFFISLAILPFQSGAFSRIMSGTA
jgi:hypothetical protein